MHEVKPKSLGGIVSEDNSIAACGSGTTKCHGFAQRHELQPETITDDIGRTRRRWIATTPAAQAWIEGT